MDTPRRQTVVRLVLNDHASLLCLLFPVVTWGMFAAYRLGWLRSGPAEQRFDRLFYFWFAIGSTLVGIPILCRRIKEVLTLLRDGIPTPGRLTSVWFMKDRGRIDYEYSYEGQTYREGLALATTQLSGTLKVGQAITVLVHPTKPAKSIVAEVFAPEAATLTRAGETAPTLPVEPPPLEHNQQQEVQVVFDRTWEWRRWIIWGAIGLAFAAQAFLRSTQWPTAIVSAAGQTLVYRPAAWLWAAFAVVLGVMLLIGIAIVTVRHILGRLIGGFVLLVTLASVVAIGPTISGGEMVLTPEGFTHESGFWWSPVVHQISFDSLKSIRVVPEPIERGLSRNFTLECGKKDGSIVKIPSSDLLKAGRRAILIRAAMRGVDVRVVEPEDW